MLPERVNSYTYNISGLDMVLILFNACLEVVNADLVVLNDNVNLKLVDAVSYSSKLGSTPGETVPVDSTDVGLQFLKVGLVICSKKKKSATIRIERDHTGSATYPMA